MGKVEAEAGPKLETWADGVSCENVINTTGGICGIATGFGRVGSFATMGS